MFHLLMHGLRGILLISIVVCCVGVSYASVVRDQFTALEASLQLSEKTLYTFVQDRELLDSAKQFCSQDAREKGARFGEKLSQMLDARYRTMSDAEMLLDSFDLWNRVQAMHSNLAIDIRDAELCIRKILMYTLQRDLRKWQIEFIQSAGLLDDFNLEDPPLRQVGLKERILDTLIAQEQVSHMPTLTVHIENPEFLDTLSRDERSLAIRSRQVVEQALRSALVMFVQKGWFQQSDINQIVPVVFLEYTADCGSVAGKYEVSYQEDATGKRSNMRTTALHLTVSTCTNIGFILQNMRLAKLIVYHELGHHVWWYKDPDPTKFTRICWEDAGSANGRCTRRDFVSDYAYDDASIPQSSQPAEDYAEHFQQRVINRRERPGFIATKLRYFTTLFGE